MESLQAPYKITGRLDFRSLKDFGSLRRSLRLPIIAAVAVLAAGCVNLDSLVPDLDGPPTGTPCQVATIWNPQVVFSPDPTRNGMAIPGLAGRLYLFGPTVGFPLSGEGSVVVDVYDPARADGHDAAVPLEEWRIDKDTLQRLLRRDDIGWGYTLFLPWSTYRPELTKVRLQARFEPVKGSPLFTAPAALTLNNGMPAPTVTSSHKDVALPQPGMNLHLDPATNPPAATTKTQDGATITLGPEPGARSGAVNPQNAIPLILNPEPGARLPVAAH